jgi:hypothetical protein
MHPFSKISPFLGIQAPPAPYPVFDKAAMLFRMIKNPVRCIHGAYEVKNI